MARSSGSWSRRKFPQYITSRCMQHPHQSFGRKTDEVVQQPWLNLSGEVGAADRGTLVGHPGLHYLMILPTTLEPILVSLSKESDTRAQRLEMTQPLGGKAGTSLHPVVACLMNA